jgi:hypothetical protein
MFLGYHPCVCLSVCLSLYCASTATSSGMLWNFGALLCLAVLSDFLFLCYFVAFLLSTFFLLGLHVCYCFCVLFVCFSVATVVAAAFFGLISFNCLQISKCRAWQCSLYIVLVLQWAPSSLWTSWSLLGPGVEVGLTLSFIDYVRLSLK